MCVYKGLKWFISACETSHFQIKYSFIISLANLRQTISLAILDTTMSKFPKDILAFVISLLEFLLMARFLLKLLGASSSSEAVAWVYQTSEPLLKPFSLAFPGSAVQKGGILEYNTLFALFVYAFIGYAAEALLTMMFNFMTPPEPASEPEPKAKSNRSKR